MLQGALIHCNIKIQDIWRLTDTVKRALNRLYAERQQLAN